jgi:hypothetical protein
MARKQMLMSKTGDWLNLPEGMIPSLHLFNAKEKSETQFRPVPYSVLAWRLSA